MSTATAPAEVTPAADSTPTAPGTLAPITAHPEAFELDGSKISDVKKAEKAYEKISTAVGEWFSADKLRTGATKVAAVAVLDLREVCLRGDNASPDWSGQVSAAYGFAYRDRIKRRYTEVGMTDTQVRTFESAVRSMLSDSGMLNQRIADYLRRTDSRFSNVKPEEIKAGETMPEELRTAIVAEKAKQTNKTGTKVLRGFTPDTVPEVFGTRAQVAAANGGSTGSAGNVGQTSPMREWQRLRERVAIHEDSGEASLAPLAVADELFHLDTVFVQRLIGPADKTMPKVTEKAKVRDRLTDRILLLTAARDVLAGELKDRAKVSELYWQG